jgi:hypothetical protein
LEEIVEIPSEFPKFSFSIENMLKIGKLLTNEMKRNQYIDEMAVFYLTQDIKLKNSKQYRAIGMMLLEKYEGLRTDINQACDFKKE